MDHSIYCAYVCHLLLYYKVMFIHIQIIKDIFLLGRGELFLTFVDMADIFMKLPPTPTTQHGVYDCYSVLYFWCYYLAQQ